VFKKGGVITGNPFVHENAPIEIRAQAKRIPAWTLDRHGLAATLQKSPVKSGEPAETVTLIPMGAARLRISAFPVIGSGADAAEWTTPKLPPVSASHCHDTDTVEALIDGKVPRSSNDNSVPRFTWWDRRGSTEWVQHDFEKPRQVSAVEVYWFDDTGRGACRVPASWRVLYRTGDQWKAVETEDTFTTKLDTFNRAAFTPIEAAALRIEVQLQPGFSGGILEWRIL
jgi:hypothetical protein